MRVAVVGGAGYIGTHVVYELLLRGHTPLVIDQDTRGPNVELVRRLTRGALWSLPASGMDFDELEGFDALIYLAAYISVEESVSRPDDYWQNNLVELIFAGSNLRRPVPHLIFASTGTAGDPANPYALSKRAAEDYIMSIAGGFNPWFKGHTTFRFFNVAGLRQTVKPTGQPTHLIRLAAMAAKGMIPELTVYGTDWDTRDGTCVRDYIHAEDIASSIVNAVDLGPRNTHHEELGTGMGWTVLEVIQSMKAVTGVDFSVKMSTRRQGDVASMHCTTPSPYLLAKHSLGDICRSTYENL